MGTLRVEFYQIGGGDRQAPVCSFTLAIGAPHEGEARCAPDGFGALYAHLRAIDAPVYVVIAEGQPDASIEPRTLILPGRKERLGCSGGWKISAVLADDMPWSGGAGVGGATLLALGDGPPAPEAGGPGDVYLDAGTGDVYAKE